MTTPQPTTWDAALIDSSRVAAAPRPVLAQRYEIQGLLGVGGMGTVYRAYDRELDEQVALKVLQRSLVSDPLTLERFRREVKLARRVTHPNVARVYDIGEHDGERFLTMELIVGESLGDKLAREGALRLKAAVAIAIAVCEGLAAAHTVGVVHRDLKPDNVILASSGRIVLTDFGIARLAGGAATRTAGVVVGTPEYMAPEQVQGKSDIDGRADLYALGVMLFQMLMGEAPWKGDSPIAIAASRLVSPPPDPRSMADVPEPLAAVVCRCMARAPSDRFASAEEVRAALREVGDLSSKPSVPLELRATQPPAAGALPKTPRHARTVVLLPVTNSGSTEDAHFAQTFGHALFDALSSYPDVVAHAENAPRGADRDGRGLGRELGAEVVVTPTLRVTAEGALRAAVRIVSVAEGLQLWAGRVDRPIADFFDLVEECTDRIASVLALPEPPRPPSGPGNAAVVELLSRAHAQSRSASLGANDRAIAMLERAISEREADYWVLSAYATALVRRVEEGDGIREEALEAQAMAERAAAMVPGSIEAHVALARVKLELGDSAGAAAALRFSPRIGHAQLQRTWGLLLADAGGFEAAIMHLSRAARLGDARSRWDEARVRALSGDVAFARSTFDAGLPESTAETLVHAARLAMWSRDAARIASVREALHARPVPARDALVAYLGAPGETKAALSRLEAQARSCGELPRRRAMWLAMAAEVAALAGDNERAMEALLAAAAWRTSDTAWLERCPLLDPVREAPGFAAVLEGARARAGAALKARNLEEAAFP